MLKCLESEFYLDFQCTVSVKLRTADIYPTTVFLLAFVCEQV